MLKDAYPIARTDDSLDALSVVNWFSTLDLSSRHWQIELNDNAKQKSAFVVRGGLYNWKQMCFRLSNACATFKLLTERVVFFLRQFKQYLYRRKINI